MIRARAVTGTSPYNDPQLRVSGMLLFGYPGGSYLRLSQMQTVCEVLDNLRVLLGTLVLIASFAGYRDPAAPDRQKFPQRGWRTG